MAIAKVDQYTNVNAAGSLGSNAVTDVTVPTHDLAIVTFHFYNPESSRYVDNASTLPVLSGATCTHIATQQDGTNNATQAFWCTGAVAGASKTLSYTVLANDIDAVGVGIQILFLSGTETTNAIRASATDADQNGGSTSGSLSFVAGDWTILTYSSDTALDQTNSGANTTAITQFQLTDGPYVGTVYRTADGTISLPASSNSYTGIVAMTVIPASGGGDEEAALSGSSSTSGSGTAVPGIEVPL